MALLLHNDLCPRKLFQVKTNILLQAAKLIASVIAVSTSNGAGIGRYLRL